MSASPHAALPAASAAPAWPIAAVSFCILALELALIRLAPAEVKAISYFTNLILIASFFGLGVGCILERGPRLGWLLPLGLAAICGFVYAARGVVIYDEARSVHYWLQDQASGGMAPRVSLFASALIMLDSVALPFAAMGQELARRMDQHPRLAAYAWDIAGSLVGTIAFAAASYAHVPPWIWPIVVAAAWALLIVRRWALGLAVALAGASFLLLATSSRPAAWSPYYLVQYEQEPEGLRVFVNSSFHQYALDFTQQDSELVKRMSQRFGLPYRRYRQTHDGAAPQRVLILGAGTGNDAAIALREGAQQIVAVEIDPTILNLGRRLNRSRPYDDPRVETRLDDARHFLHTCREKFDLIVFATLDSQTLLSGASNLRLENYVYTVEAFRDARKLLADDGMVGLYYSVMKPWLYHRIVSTAREAFDDRIELTLSRDPFLFNTTLVAAPGLAEFGGDPRLLDAFGDDRPNTDDWPYLYLEQPTIAPVYWKLFAAVGTLAAAALGLVIVTNRDRTPTRRVRVAWPRRSADVAMSGVPSHAHADEGMARHRKNSGGLHLDFLLLGVGFTLVESAAIVRLALLFGSTWVVNAVVVGAALATIFLANLMVAFRRAPSLDTAWLGLLGSLAVNWLFPLQTLFAYPWAVRSLAAAILAGAPIFFAAVCFSRLFADQPSTGRPLGMNLVGAMLGAMLEYLSVYLGMSDLWLVPLGVYALALLASRRVAWGRLPAPTLAPPLAVSRA